MVLSWILTLIAFSSPSSAQEQLRAGAAAFSLNPPAGISLAGFGGGGRRHWGLPESPFAFLFKANEGVHDDVRAKALVLQWRGKKVAIVSVDLVASSILIRQRLGQRLKDIGIEEKNIFLTATHTHSAPGGFAQIGLWEIIAADIFMPYVLETFTNSVEKAIRTADANAKPATLAVQTSTIANAVRNRRSDDKMTPPITLIKVDSSSGPVATVVNFPIHGTFMNSHNLQVSADIPGSIERHLTEKTKAVTIFVNGAEGDVSPDQAQSDFTVLESAGERIATQVFSMWQKMKPGAIKTLKVAEFEQPLGENQVNVAACIERPLDIALTLPLGLPRQALLSALVINDTLFVGIPGEPTTSIGNLIRLVALKSGYFKTSIFGLTNDHISYIVDELEYFAGGYESCSSLYGPEIGQTILVGVDKLLGHL